MFQVSVSSKSLAMYGKSSAEPAVINHSRRYRRPASRFAMW